MSKSAGTASRFQVEHSTGWSDWDTYVGQVGAVESVSPSVLHPNYDGIRLRMPDGELRMFSRQELEEVEPGSSEEKE